MLFWSNVDQRLKPNFLALRHPISTPDINLLAAVFQENNLTIGMHPTAASDDLPTNIDGELDVCLKRLEHLANLLIRCPLPNEMNHAPD